MFPYFSLSVFSSKQFNIPVITSSTVYLFIYIYICTLLSCVVLSCLSSRV